ncbi:TetR/AcrR family transcriptional regulator [Micromonospora echinaurantiaca]|uniref:TetR/AcrR family transcriptional regulator n=1 Tax=Micromonospora echinaurantiaca TaxID=47857 RepID=UPI0037A98EE2
MSELTSSHRRRRVRAEARRNAAAILDAAVRLLGERPNATVDDVAAAAGLSRQTVYAHFPSRDALLTAVVGRITEEAMAAIDAAAIDEGPAPDALLRLLDAGWRTALRYPVLDSAPAGDGDDELHRPVVDRLLRLIARGQAAGEFDPALPPAWLVATTIALGHAAGAEVAAGRLAADQAAAALRTSILRVYGAARP